MIFAASLGKYYLAAIVMLLGIAALLVYSPIAIIREIRRPADEELPEWMGKARGRKLRLAIAMGVVGVLAAAGWIAVMFG